MAKAWEKRADESGRWFARFEVYRLLGPSRSIEKAFQATRDLEGLKGERPGHAWYQAASEMDWPGRAEAWDRSERERLQAIEMDRRFDAREQRLGMIDQLIGAVFGVLQGANLRSMDADEARAWLPTMRILFKDLITAQRLELGLPVVDAVGGDGAPITADDLMRAQQELDGWDGDGGGSSSFIRLRNALADLYPDENSARRIASQSGLALSRLRLSGVAVDNWHAILREAENTAAVDELVAVVESEYGRSRDFARAVRAYKGAS